MTACHPPDTLHVLRLILVAGGIALASIAITAALVTEPTLETEFRGFTCLDLDLADGHRRTPLDTPGQCAGLQSR